MTRDSLTGSRIRERRLMAGHRQADLARMVGISASYLNLIEHNRRRIGGKLLLAIAEALEVEVTMLTEGAEAALIATLREAEADASIPGVEIDRIDEFAGRFPGWAELMAAGHRRIRRLERTVETLSDRIAHDPEVSSAAHELLSAATAIRSTASILAETDELDPMWRNRFHSNLNVDSERLANASRALVDYLGSEEGRTEDAVASPQDELDTWLHAADYRFEMLEDGSAAPEDMVTRAKMSGDLSSAPAQHMALGILRQYARDATDLPLARLRSRIAPDGSPDPAALARLLDVPVALVLRRLAAMPEIGAGFVACDRAGALLIRKPAAGFDIPRYGAACTLWPLFQALIQPGTILRQGLQQVGRQEARFESFATATPVSGPVYNMPPLVQSMMLVLPQRGGVSEAGDAPLKIGSTCRVCSRGRCPGRREPSILGEDSA